MLLSLVGRGCTLPQAISLSTLQVMSDCLRTLVWAEHKGRNVHSLQFRWLLRLSVDPFRFYLKCQPALSHIWTTAPVCKYPQKCVVFVLWRNIAMSNGIIFFCPMFIDELFNSAKSVSMLLSHYKAQNKVYVTLNKAEKPFWRFCENKKAAQDQPQYMRSKAAL